MQMVVGRLQHQASRGDTVPVGNLAARSPEYPVHAQTCPALHRRHPSPPLLSPRPPSHPATHPHAPHTPRRPPAPPVALRPTTTTRAGDLDGKVASWDEHEDSVYGLAWSAADPWLLASMSYDGRVALNKVPKNVKYRILL